MTPSRLLAVVFAMGLLGSMTLSGLDFDFGGSIDDYSSFPVTIAPGNVIFAPDQRDKVAVWGDMHLGSAFSIAAEASYNFTLQVPFLINLDYLKIDWRVVPWLSTTLGRFTFMDFSGHVLNHTLDGAQFVFDLPVGRITTGIGFSGLQLKPVSLILMSRSDTADQSNSAVFFAAPRLIEKLEVLFPGLFSRLDVNLSFIFQQDLRANDQLIQPGQQNQTVPGFSGGALTTEYFGLGLSGAIVSSLYYDGFFYWNAGSTLSYSPDSASVTGFSYQYSPIQAFVGGIGLRYYMEEALSSRVEIQGIFSSGDADSTSYLEGNSSGSLDDVCPHLPGGHRPGLHAAAGEPDPARRQLLSQAIHAQRDGMEKPAAHCKSSCVLPAHRGRHFAAGPELVFDGPLPGNRGGHHSELQASFGSRGGFLDGSVPAKRKCFHWIRYPAHGGREDRVFDELLRYIGVAGEVYMKRYIIMALTALMLAPSLFAQSQATLKESTGKVEVKDPGGAWRPAAVGTKLAMGAFISTGFSSTALLDLGTSTLTVAPLTRMQLVDLVARQGTVSTTLSLKVGKVRAEVKSTSGVRQDFTLKGPQATAAVRGTEFVFDGLTVNVVNGVVLFSNSLGQSRSVPAGEGSSTDGFQLPTTGDQQLDSQVGVVPYTSPTGGGVIQTGQQQPATVTITWQ